MPPVSVERHTISVIIIITTIVMITIIITIIILTISGKLKKHSLVKVPLRPQDLLATVGWLWVAGDTVVTWATGALFTSGNWKTMRGEELPRPDSALCFRGPISWKEAPSGDEGCEWEEGDWVWYPLEGLPGLGLALPEEPAYRMTPPGTAERERSSHLEVSRAKCQTISGFGFRESH